MPWLNFKSRAGLEVLVPADQRLFTPFDDWVGGATGQAATASFRTSGEPLFFPNATK